MNDKVSADPLACRGEFSKDRVTKKLLSRFKDKWTLPIVRCLSARNYRFGELRRAIDGISSKVLTQQLKSLELEDLVVRTVLSVDPPSVEYSLTETGRKLAVLQSKLLADDATKTVHVANVV